MSQVAVHHPSSYGFSGQVGLPATVTNGVSATFSWQNLNPSTPHTVIWGDGTGNGSFTSSASGTGSAAHTYASTGTYVQKVTETATGRTVAQRTFTVPYAGGAGFAPKSMGELPEPAEGNGNSAQVQNGDGEYEDYDPGDYTVAEVMAEAVQQDDDQFIRDVIAAEQAGKNRVSLVSQLQDMLPYDPEDHTVSEVEDYASANPDELDDIIAAEEAGKGRVTLLNHLYSLRP